MCTPLRFAALSLLVALAPTVHAQIDVSQINGSAWVQDEGASAQQMYAFGSDGTYTFRSGLRSGFISHSGTWDIIDGGRRLQLRATKRTEARNGRERIQTARRTFVLSIEDLGDGFTAIDGVRFTRQ